MKSMIIPALAAAISVFSNAAVATPTASAIANAADGGIPALLACLRAEEIPLIGAHRGGPIPEFPENALATLERTTEMAPVFLEVDVQQTFDDQLFLNHDPVLARNTVGHGTIREMRWSRIESLRLRDQTGQPTAYTAPKLSEVLAWAEGNALLLLDVKPTTETDLLVQAVRDAGAEARTMYLTYTIKQALSLRALLPEAVIALPMFDRESLVAAQQAGLVDERLLAMVRPRAVDERFIPELEALGATVLSASYGGAQSPDALYRTAQDAAVYHELANQGPRLIVANRPFEAAASMLALPGYVEKLARCGIRG